jgi:regulator of protease activity HflC (stomatin/prohibitin superfamily)
MKKRIALLILFAGLLIGLLWALRVVYVIGEEERVIDVELGID